jgi:putative SOS response-associated peptidase YedK
MVEQNAKKYAVRFKARVQLDLYRDLFQRRLDGEKLYVNRAMELPFTSSAATPEEREIGELIERWHAEQIPLLEQELFAQRKRLGDAERQLQSKVTKKAENDKRIAANKIEKLKRDLERHQNRGGLSEIDERIFPLHYVTMVCADDSGDRHVRPVRYLMRPHGQDASFDAKFNGCYNARLDSLESVRWWKDCFGKRHGVILARKFYENVEAARYTRTNRLPNGCEDREKLVLCFEPDNVEYMVIPALWDTWTDGKHSLVSAAIITDEPAPEIAEAGHDRTPVFLTNDAADAWLSPANISKHELLEVLSDREEPHYSHRVLGAA